MVTKSVFIFTLLLGGFSSEAKLKVVTTTTTLADMARALGGEDVDVLSITKRGQDPHFVEAKPSYMVKLRSADLLVSVGLGLEVGWIDLVRRGGRNPKINQGAQGNFVAGEFIEALEVPEGKIDRAHGDVHPEGNPHFHLDPVRYLKVARALSERMALLDTENKEKYLARWKSLESKIDKKLSLWQKKAEQSGVKKAIAYHRSLNYFFHRFGLEIVNYLEPKPGVAPTARHIVSLIKQAKDENVRCILNEDYFEETAARRVAAETQARIVSVSVEVQTNYVALLDQLVAAIQTCSKGMR